MPLLKLIDQGRLCYNSALSTRVLRLVLQIFLRIHFDEKLFSGHARFKLSSRCASDLESITDLREISCSEEEESQIDFKFLHQKCATSQKQKRLWRLSAPINASDFDSPEHNATLNPNHATSSAMPKDAASSLWSSPQHECKIRSCPSTNWRSSAVAARITAVTSARLAKLLTVSNGTPRISGRISTTLSRRPET